jgi:multiple antibiotic resistance protein
MEFFGISIPGLRIAGGLMVTRVAMSMLAPKDDGTQPEARREAVEKSDVSFTPLAMPSLSGPGAIAITIGMASEVDHVVEYIAILVGIVVVCLLCWAALRASTSVVRFLGANGLDAVSRIMGFLLLCVGVQFIVNGVVDIVTQQAFLTRIAEGVSG